MDLNNEIEAHLRREEKADKELQKFEKKLIEDFEQNMELHKQEILYNFKEGLNGLNYACTYFITENNFLDYENYVIKFEPYIVFTYNPKALRCGFPNLPAEIDKQFNQFINKLK